jgi:undecaprenyl pyrophosphate synthase
MTSRLRKWLISSPPAEWALNQIRELLIGALRQGPIPRHVAFVMDGNRRFARSHRIETVEGHNLGFEALARVGSETLTARWQSLTKLTLYPSRSSKSATNPV